MKKILLGTTAVIALGTMSTQSFAADPISLELGGFMRHYIGVTSSDEVANGGNGAARAVDLGQDTNTEVYFSGSTTLDNGLTVAAMMQLEADGGNAGRSIDNSQLTISSDAMGALTVGYTGHAGDDFRVAAPNASNFDWGDFGGWAQFATSAAAASAANDLVSSDLTGTGDKAAKLKYVSPAFADMVQVFASYSAAEGTGTSQGSNLQNVGTGNGATNTGNDGSTIGASLSGEFSGASVEAAVYNFTDGANNVAFNNIGINVGMAGFTVGGSYADFDDQDVGDNSADGKAWDLGVGYATGPYAVTARYYNSQQTGSAAVTGDNEDTIWALDATYDLGAGVKLAATYFDQSSDPEGTGVANAARDTSGVIAGIEVGF